VDPGGLGELPASIPAPLRQAALSGDAAAVYEIASRAADGRGLGPDPGLAARLFERAALAGLAPAQERLAMFYEKGFGMPRDSKLAVTWYERAAIGGNTRAMHNLATLPTPRLRWSAGVPARSTSGPTRPPCRLRAQRRLRDHPCTGSENGIEIVSFRSQRKTYCTGHRGTGLQI
jgi:TPR repeat protein